MASLEQELGAKPKFFAYPYGFGTPATDNILSSHGIPNIFTLRAKVNKLESNRFFIGRVLVTTENWSQIAGWASSP